MEHQVEHAFDVAVEAAWADFRRTLADWIDALGDGETLSFAALPSGVAGQDDGDPDAGPDASPDAAPVVISHRGGVLVLDVDVARLPPARRDQAAGERWGADDPGCEPVWFEETTAFPRHRVDEVAVRCVAALRDDVLVMHPSLLVTSPRSWTPSPRLRARQAAGDAAACDPGSIAPPLAWPGSAEDLDRLVDAALTPFFGHVPARDADGDLPVDAGGGGMLWLRSRPDGRVVQLYSFVVSDVADDDLGLREAARLNSDYDIVKFRYADRTLQAVVDLRTWPFAADSLRGEVGALVGFLQEQGPVLAARLGGRTWHESAEAGQVPAPCEGPADLSESADVVRRQLLQIEAAAAGEFDLDADQVRRICRHDPDLMLALIEHEQAREIDWAAQAAASASGGHGGHGGDPVEHRLAAHERRLSADRLRLLRLALHAVLTSD